MSFDVFDIAASGMHAQRIKMDTVSSNIANVNTTRDEFGNKAVYHKKQVTFKEMALEKGYRFPEGNVSVEFDPPSEPYLVGGVSMGGNVISKGVMVDAITDANNPTKIIGLEGYGLEINERVPIEPIINEYNQRYIQTKIEKMHHIIK